jgi:hypothetical protein
MKVCGLVNLHSSSVVSLYCGLVNGALWLGKPTLQECGIVVMWPCKRSVVAW